mgnify:FL=1
MREGVHMFKKLLKTIIFIALIAIPTRFYFVGQKSATINPGLGLSNDKLQPCPIKPNCVSSFASVTDEKHFIAAIKVSQNPLKKIQENSSRMNLNIISTDEKYLRLSSISAIFKFVDDIEFYYNSTEGLLHFRSSSRVGHSDMGKNRSRLQDILELNQL